MSRTGPHILYAEDEENDAVLFKAASRSCAHPHTLHIVSNGREAIQYLSGEHPYNSRSQYPFPSFLLLDVYMPVLGGLDVLKWLQDRPDFQHLPVFLLSSFVHREDLETTAPLAIDGYWNKSANFHDWVTFIDDCLLATTTRSQPKPYSPAHSPSACVLPSLISPTSS